MQTLSVKSTRASVVPRRGRTTTVAVKALSLQEATNWFGQAFVRIFSPDDTKVKNYPVNNFSGRISHHEGPSRPFKDGFQSNAPLPPSSSIEATNQEGAVGYVEDAVKGVVSGLVSEPSGNEPEAWTGAAGWQGGVHSSENKRDAREGFHVKKY
ncbi:hypothetical protein HXX76_009258 [Chlamydomonas incerta]|uniref:Uncharacterized protein n=1 Tax=Chlamydomonas incerta TaxID=51695 RepID=A0A835SUH7_CHLIN|nr:hypothetical protein HXX76_009258 [Chlamydomonas incerta]|eukprot:KAG2431762.1 hypothetical protein HXX76_009258 [Chlamydomonas incerta]